MLLAYEIETYTGGVPGLVPVPEDAPAFPAGFTARVRNHQPVTGAVRGAIRSHARSVWPRRVA